MTLKHLAVTTVLSAAFCAPAFAQSNTQCVESAKHQARKDHKADKAQAKADKAEAKALDSHKVKKAARKQDEADRKAAQADAPQR